MGNYDNDVIEVLGKDVWDLLVENVNTGIITGQHLIDISAQLHPRVRGNHLRREKDMRLPSDGSELREILSDWWNQELCDLDPATAFEKLVNILKSPSVNLPAVAAELNVLSKAHITSSTLDSVINSLPEMFKSEPEIAQRLSEIFKSIELNNLGPTKAPREAYKSIDEFFNVMIKRQNVQQKLCKRNDGEG